MYVFLQLQVLNHSHTTTGEYYILQQILNRQLHTTDEECTNFAIQLMDKLEAYKASNSGNDAVVDDVAAKAYVENFALETFARGDDAQRSNKVTRQTADIFQAAGTFLDLLSIWGPLDPEAAAKSKFAKYHALRIAKALKAGEDPNATNPIVEPPPQAGVEGEEELEAELKALEGKTDASTSSYQPPSVETAPDPDQRSFAGTSSSTPGPLITSSQNYQPPNVQSPEHDVSPIEPPEEANSRNGSVGGGYFPKVSATAPGSNEPPETPNPVDFYSGMPPLPSAPSSVTQPSATYAQQPDITSQAAPVPSPHPAPASVASIPVGRAAPVPGPSSVPPAGGYKKDDESIAAAQKHAKWAISALNFEDVDTAVKELHIALRSLGAL